MYAIRYFRDARIVEWYRIHGINKPVAWVTGRSHYVKREDAQKVADHINSLGARPPIEVVTVRG